jgi:hypothetical protein
MLKLLLLTENYYTYSEDIARYIVVIFVSTLDCILSFTWSFFSP